MTFRCTALLGLLTACSPNPLTSSLKSGSGGVIIEHGGDFLHCRAADASAFAGNFTLDYVVTYDAHVGRAQDPTEATFAALTARTTRIIDAKLPELSDSWRRYLALLQSADPAGSRVWRPSGSGLADLPDEALVRKIDDNCKTERDGKVVPDLNQMVRRSYYVDGGGLKIFYEYDQVAFDDARNANALQLSYLVVHEWLWDFVREPNANRWVNRLLHSQSVDTMSTAAVRDYLRSYGVTTDEAGQVGHAGAQELRLQQLVEASPACDAARRIAVPFPADAARFAVAPGKSVSFETDTPRFGDTWPTGICGVAALFGRRAVGGDTAPVTIEIRRGEAPARRDVVASSGPVQQELFTGFCADQFCDDRGTGELAFHFKPGEIGKSRWRITASVPAGASNAVEISYPYLVFYAKNAP